MTLKETPGMHVHREGDHVRAPQEGCHQQAKEKRLRRNHTCQNLDLVLLATRTESKNNLLCKPPSLWYHDPNIARMVNINLETSKNVLISGLPGNG